MKQGDKIAILSGARITFRGHDIVFLDDCWFFKDTGKSVPGTHEERGCGVCNLPNREDGHDACIGELEGVMNACCGHGNDKEAYIQYDHPDYANNPNLKRIAGVEAIKIMRSE